MRNSRLSVLCVAVAWFLLEPVSADVLIKDTFEGPQTGLWAPVEWFDLDSDRFHTRDGKFVVLQTTFLAFDLSRKSDVINRAGGFVVEVDVWVRRRGGRWAGVGIGPETVPIEDNDFAVMVQNDFNLEAEDRAFNRGKSWNIGKSFEEGQRIRIEVDTDDIGTTGKDATANVFFGDTQVVTDYRFPWGRGPTYLRLHTSGISFFDNLVLTTAKPVIEFAQAESSGSETAGTAELKVLIRRPDPGATYTVDYDVSGGTATNGVDYVLSADTLIFSPGQTEKTITIPIKHDGIDEYDESIAVSLSNARGPGVRLGHTIEHTSTIVGRWPTVSFGAVSSRGPESSGQVKIPVHLSHSCTDTVAVRYGVTGGTAEKGKDYTLDEGTLRFGSGEVTQNITIGIVDDLVSENSLDETIMISLRDCQKASFGKKTRHAYGIIDNEPGIEFDGAVWIPMMDKHVRWRGKTLLRLNDLGQLEWVPTYAAQITVKLPEQRLDRVGDVVELAWLYKSNGPTEGSGLADLTERWGSGDLRWGVLDSNKRPVSAKRTYGRTDEAFGNYLGYQVRFSPHVPTDFTGGRWAKRTNPGPDQRTVLSGGYQSGGYNYYGHNQPVGKFTPFIIKLERTAPGTIVYSLSLNGVTQTFTDSDPRNQPQKIDAMAINFPNPRRFEYITLSKLEDAPR